MALIKIKSGTGGASGNSTVDTSTLYVAQTVATYAAAQAAATGTQKKIITVTTDENSGSTNTKYFYEGVSGVLDADFTKVSSTDFDIAEGQQILRVSRMNALISSFLSTNGYVPQTVPPAPTNGVVNDTANTFTFTLATGYIATDHEYSKNNGAWTQCSSNVLTVADEAIAIGGLKVRVRADVNRSPSAILSNATAFTVAVVLSSKFIDVGLDTGATATYNSQVFESDVAYMQNTSGGSTLYTDPGLVSNTTYSSFYQSVRNTWANSTLLSYLFSSIANGNYTMHIHTRAFTSTVSSTNFKINNVTVETGFDAYTAAGNTTFKAVIKSYNFTVTGGQIVLDFILSGQFNLAGIEIVAQGVASKLA